MRERRPHRPFLGRSLLGRFYSLESLCQRNTAVCEPCSPPPIWRTRALRSELATASKAAMFGIREAAHKPWRILACMCTIACPLFNGRREVLDTALARRCFLVFLGLLSPEIGGAVVLARRAPSSGDLWNTANIGVTEPPL